MGTERSPMMPCRRGALALVLLGVFHAGANPQRDDCLGNCMNPSNPSLDPIIDNSPLPHMRHSYASKDRPSLPVESIAVSVNEASTWKAEAPLGADASFTQSGLSQGQTMTGDYYVQTAWMHPEAGDMPVPAHAPPPPPQGGLAPATASYQMAEENCPAEFACNSELGPGDDGQMSDHCSLSSAYGGIVPTGCDALFIQSRGHCAGVVCQR